MKNNLRKLSLLLVLVLVMGVFVACGNNETQDEEPTDTTETTQTEETPEADTETEEETEVEAEGEMTGDISVVSREDGSGTRGAFVEIVGVVDENDDDITTTEATIINSTDGVLSTVANDPQAIGYISLGSLNDTVKALNVDGAEATVETINSGDYPIARPFNIAYKEAEISEGTQDFINFILSEEGQAIVEEEGYVPTEGEAYEPMGNDESITIAGSTSVSPLMEKLAEAYQVHNPDWSFDIQSTGSSAGVSDAISGVAQIGMASRELKEEEQAEVDHTVIAMDGIAVIVNQDNPVEDITLDAIKEIYLGNTSTWEEI